MAFPSTFLSLFISWFSCTRWVHIQKIFFNHVSCFALGPDILVSSAILPFPYWMDHETWNYSCSKMVEGTRWWTFQGSIGRPVYSRLFAQSGDHTWERHVGVVLNIGCKWKVGGKWIQQCIWHGLGSWTHSPTLPPWTPTCIRTHVGTNWNAILNWWTDNPPCNTPKQRFHCTNWDQSKVNQRLLWVPTQLFKKRLSYTLLSGPPIPKVLGNCMGGYNYGFVPQFRLNIPLIHGDIQIHHHVLIEFNHTILIVPLKL